MKPVPRATTRLHRLTTLCRLVAVIWILAPPFGHAAAIPTWTRLAPAGQPPHPREAHSAIFDRVGDRMIVFGGWVNWGDTWELSAGTPEWTQLHPPVSPHYRANHSAVYDPVRQRMVIFGGSFQVGAAGSYLNDTWELSLTGGQEWTQLSTTGATPRPRRAHTAIYDPVRDRMLVFGGDSTQNYYGQGIFFNDLWALSLSGTPTWTELHPDGTLPSPRTRHSAVYDPARDRMLVFGGTIAGSDYNDVWELTLSGAPTWAQLDPDSAPPAPRVDAGAIYDPAGDQMVVFGGGAHRGPPDRFNDAWALSLSGTPTWTDLDPDGTPPSPRPATAVYDPMRQRMLVFGGGQDNDTWELALPGISHVITASAGPNGSISPSGAVSVDHGASQSFTISPDPHYHVADVRVDGVSVGSVTRYTFDNVAADHAIAASFAIDTYVITASAGWNGSISPSGRVTVDYGSSQSFTITPDPGYQVADVLVDGISTGVVTTYTFFNVAADHAITARFEMSMTTDGGWVPFFGPQVLQHAAVYDPIRSFMVVIGGPGPAPPGPETWVLPLDSAPVWTRPIPSFGDGFRYGHTAIYDPVRDCIIVFGGDTFIFGRGGVPSNDTWVLPLANPSAWVRLTTSGTPPSGRRNHAAIYDPVRDRMLIFGGYDGRSHNNEVWALSLDGTPAWTPLAPAGTPPEAPQDCAAIYDPVGDRMILLAARPDGMWALSLDTDPSWMGMTTVGTPPFVYEGFAATYDPARRSMVVSGGRDPRTGGATTSTVWTLALTETPTWTRLEPSGPLPMTRADHTAIYDVSGDRMIICGGRSASQIPGTSDWVHANLNDAWALTFSDPPTWSPLGSSGTQPPAQWGHSVVCDPAQDRIVVFGGYRYSGGQEYYSAETWLFTLGSGSQWTRIEAAGTPPQGRIGHTAILDPLRDRMIVFGGYATGPLNDVWALSLAGTPTWTELSPGGPAPSPRWAHTAVYDGARNRMIVFGGDGSGSFPDGGSYLGDVWSLELAESGNWSHWTVPGAGPTPRRLHSAIYDPVRDRMVIHAGYDGTVPYPSGYRDDVWSLDCTGSATWEEVHATGERPIGRYGHTALYDPLRDRMVVFGGADPNVVHNGIWALPLCGGVEVEWSLLRPAGGPPSGRFNHAATYDPLRDRMIVFGGREGCCNFLPRSDTWALEWGFATNAEHCLTVKVVGNGTVTKTPDLPQYEHGATVELMATPSSGWRFAGWSGNADGTENPMMLVMDGNKHVTATFTIAMYTITASAGANGSIAPSGAVSVDHGASQSFTIAADPHYHVADVLVDGASVGAVTGYTFDNVTADHAIAASFAIDTYVITASAGPHGSISPSGPVSVDHGASQSFTIAADPHYHVADVLVDGASVGAVTGYTFDSVTADHAIAASFAIDTYVLTITVQGGGAVARSPDLPRYDHGSTVWLTTLPAPGWAFKGWSGDVGGAEGAVSLVMDGDKTVAATFALLIAFDFKPQRLNPNSKGRCVTGYLRPPAPYLASQLDVPSIRLNGTVAVSNEHPPRIEHHDTRLRVRFLRSEVMPTLASGDSVVVTVTGTIAGEAFVGTDTIVVKAPKIHAPLAGAQLAGGTTTVVAWDAPDGASMVTLASSMDDGVTWNVEAPDIPNTGSHAWTVPGVVTSQARLQIMWVYAVDETGVVPESEFAVSDAFSIVTLTGVGEVPARLALRPANPVTGPLVVSFSLESARRAVLAVYDVGGRQVVSRDVGSSGPGWHTTELVDLPAGIYIVRLSQAGRYLSARVAVIR